MVTANAEVKEKLEACEETQSALSNIAGIDVRRLGFRALLGWHYCILFAPCFITVSGYESQHLFLRQTILYIALACAFAIFIFIIRKYSKRKSKIASRPILIFACLLGCVTTLLSMLCFTLDFSLYLAAVVVLGFSEAFLMVLWLMMFVTLAKKQTYKILGVDVITGAIIAALTQVLVFPANYFVTACLPLCSLFSFLTLKRKFDFVASGEEKKEDEIYTQTNEQAENQTQDQTESSEETLNKKEKTGYSTPIKYILRRNIPVALFALAFGLLQGGFLTDDIPFLLAVNPVVFLGIIVVGLIIFFSKERFCTHEDANMLYRFSLVFFMFGVIVLIASSASPSMFGTTTGYAIVLAAGMAILAGFNLYDFGNMMVCIGIIRSYGSKYAVLLIIGRVLVYACMAFGSIVGYFLVSSLNANSHFDALVIICCITLLALVITVALISTNAEDYIKLLTVAGKGGQAEQKAIFAHIDPCQYCTSAKDCRLRPMIKNETEEHTNKGCICSKLGVGDSAQAQGTLSAASYNGAASAQGENSFARKDVATSPEQAVNAEPAATNTANAQEIKAGRKSVTKVSSAQAQVAEPKEKISPWREACKEIIRRYGLSKREAEIFKLIAKGRNAEYVAQELFISIHTAKTHIANIYSKLDVHSSQEMLDLIDAFRAEIEEEAKAE